MTSIQQIWESCTELTETNHLSPPLWPTGEEEITLVDQTRLPFDYHTFIVHSASEMALSIKKMHIRGSGAIGCAGAFGAYLIVQSAPNEPDQWESQAEMLCSARPTAVILRLAVKEVLDAAGNDPEPLVAAAKAATAFFARQVKLEQAIGRYGALVVPDGATILTHCNSGAMAGAGFGGRVLSVIRTAVDNGKQIKVIAQETRPYLQGARITAWELHRLNIPVALITDGMSGALMERGEIDVCLVGSDRLAINGDLVNKVGTYLVALAAKQHNVPFYTATTYYNVDEHTASGNDIPIEMRPAQEVLTFQGQPITIEGVEALYPAFDITPAALLTGIITDSGIITPPYEQKLRRFKRESMQ